VLFVAVPFFVLLFFLYVWRLGTLVSGYSISEITTIRSSSSLSTIKNNPINAPHKLLQFVFQHFGHHGAIWMRSVSVFFAFIFFVSLFLILKKWFGNFIAFLGTTLLAATPWVVLIARSATADIMWLCPVLVIFGYAFLAKSQRWQSLAWLGLMFCLVVAIYTPGLVWFMIAAFALGWRQILDLINRTNFTAAVTGLVMFMLLVTPLGYGFYLHPSLIKDWLLVPHSIPALLILAKQAGWALASLAYRAKQHSNYMLGRMATLSITQSILALVGIYAMGKSAKRELFALLTLLAISLVAVSLNANPILMTLCLPALAIFDAAALRFLHLKWLRVFPLNPLPKTFAAVLISMLVFFQAGYALRYSLAAWPHSIETRKAYVLKYTIGKGSEK